MSEARSTTARMGALKGSVTVRRYFVRGAPPIDRARIAKGVRAHLHTPIDPRGDVERSHGWAWVEDPTTIDLESDKIFYGDAVALAMRVDTLKPPAAVVKRLVHEGLRALGRRPSKAEKRAYQQEIVRKLRGQYYPVTRSYDMVWVLDAGRVLFFSHAKGANELFVDLFAKSFGLELVPDGPGQVAARLAPEVAGLRPTPEMMAGFAGLPGRGSAMEEDDG